MTDRVVPESSVSRPYWDDFDEEKQFYRILFRPGYSVQARELTQLSTILQKQIDRFGSHIFKNGSIVLGAETYFDKKVVYLKLQDTYSGETVNINNFLNQNIEDANHPDVTGTVVAVAEKTSNGSDPKTLIVQLTGKNSFSDGTTIHVIGSTIYATLQTTSSTGYSSIVKINEGVFFLNGFFVKNDASVLILDKYMNTPSYRIGLQINDSIVTEGSDTSLLDPALESSNNQAPGASRYKIDLVLSKRSLDSVDDSKFIELLRIENGVIITQILYPQYSELEKTLARRTYDESGDYTVRPFGIHLKSHIGNFATGLISAPNNSTVLLGTNTQFLAEVANNDTLQYDQQFFDISSVTDNTHITITSPTTAPIPVGSLLKVIKEDVYTIQLDPGKAYIKGYEFETVSPSYLTSNLGRDTANTTNFDILLNYGNFFYGNNANGLIDTVSSAPIVDLHSNVSANVATGTNYSNTKVGTARVAAVDYVSGNGTNRRWRVHLYDIRITNANASFANVNSISTSNTKNATIDISTDSKFGSNSANESVLTDVGFNTLVFRFPQNSIKPASITGQEYTSKAIFTNQNFTAQTSPTLTLASGQNYFGTGTLDSLSTQANFKVIVRDRMSSNLTTGQYLDYSNNGVRVSISTPTTATITAAANSTFAADIIVNVNQSTSNPKTKTLVSANTSAIINVAQYGGILVSGQQTRVAANLGQVLVASGYISNSNSWISLFLSDATNIRVIQDANTANDLSDPSKDVTARFEIDNGQRDTFYDHARIKLKAGSSAPTGNVICLVDYYTHTGSGYATVDSYPDVADDAGYKAIPTFVSPTTGQVYQLRDCIDFRPRRKDANTGTSSSDLTTSPGYTLENYKLFDPATTFEINTFSYYLSRIDKVILTKDLAFKIIEGIPSLKPIPPADDPNGMTLYVLTIPAFTYSLGDISIRYIENKRYTMRDIGVLEKRIQSLEYYNTLNLLEKKATDMLIPDADGIPRSKYGVLVDSFVGFQIADVGAGDLFCSMDTQNGELRPYIIQNSLSFNQSSQSGTSTTGIVVTLPYTTETLAEQTSATTFEPVAAYSFADWLGSIQLIPESDYWYDTVQAPDVVVNLNGQNDNWAQLGQLLEQLGASSPQNPFGTVWNSWQTNWVGTSVIDSSVYNVTTSQGVQDPNLWGTGGDLNVGTLTSSQTIQRTTTNVTEQQSRTGTTTTLSSETITKSLGNKIIDVSIIPYIRAQDVKFVARNLRPNRIVKCFFDDIDVTGYCERLDKLTLDANVAFRDSTNAETITNQNGNTAIVVMSDSNLLYVRNLTGRISANDVITGANSGISANVTVYTHRSANVINANATTITLNSYASTANTDYVDDFITIVTGPGVNQIRKITAYDGNTKIATLDFSWDTVPTANSRYTLGLPMTTPSGSLTGIFHLPSDSDLKFRTGERVFKITDTISGAYSTSTTSGDSTFYAQGLLETQQQDYVSLTVPVVTRTTVTEDRTLNNTVTSEQVVGGGQTYFNGYHISQQQAEYYAARYGVPVGTVDSLPDVPVATC